MELAFESTTTAYDPLVILISAFGFSVLNHSRSVRLSRTIKWQVLYPVEAGYPEVRPDQPRICPPIIAIGITCLETIPRADISSAAMCRPHQSCQISWSPKELVSPLLRYPHLSSMPVIGFCESVAVIRRCLLGRPRFPFLGTLFRFPSPDSINSMRLLH